MPVGNRRHGALRPCQNRGRGAAIPCLATPERGNTSITPEVWWRGWLQRHDVPLCLNLFQRNQLTAIAAGAMSLGLFPGLGTGKIRIPEGPRPALARPALVDLAGAAFGMEENAIAVGKLDQALTDSNPPYIALFELLHVQFQEPGQPLDFLFIDPDISGRSRATIAALGAFEM